MASGTTRQPTLRERENNKRRERRRRAITSKIFTGLRMYGNYKLPKHCDNNEVLKALCDEAGWTVEADGTTYKKGCKPVEMMQMVGGSAVISHCTSYYPSPCCASYNPSRGTSSFVSPFTSFYVANPNNAANPSNAADGNSLIPWLKNLSPGPSASTSKFPHLFMQNGPFSAPVTPALNSHSEPTPQFKSDCPSGLGQQQQQHSFQPFSTLPTPVGQVLNPKWINVGVPQGGQAPPPAISIVAPNPIGFKEEVFVGSGGSGMSLPGKSVTCSSAVAATSSDHTADIPMADAVSSEFAFKSSISPALVKAWKGEKVHEATVADDLELTLGNSKTRLLRK